MKLRLWRSILRVLMTCALLVVGVEYYVSRPLQPQLTLALATAENMVGISRGDVLRVYGPPHLVKQRGKRWLYWEPRHLLLFFEDGIWVEIVFGESDCVEFATGFD